MVIQVQEAITKSINDISAIGLNLEDKLNGFEKNWKLVHIMITALY